MSGDIVKSPLGTKSLPVVNPCWQHDLCLPLPNTCSLPQRHPLLLFLRYFFLALHFTIFTLPVAFLQASMLVLCLWNHLCSGGLPIVKGNSENDSGFKSTLSVPGVIFKL